MKKIKPSCENEMVYEFLKMEITSERYVKQIESIIENRCIERTIISNGNILSCEENALRAEVLGDFRGYNRNEGIFENFPAKIDWVWTVFNKDDIRKILYIEYSYWNELSNYTGSPLEAAKTILSGKTVYDVPNDGFINIYNKLKNGVSFPPLIMLTDVAESRYILLEGHARMTGYCIDPDLFTEVPVLLGYCEPSELQKWYGEMPKRATMGDMKKPFVISISSPSGGGKTTITTSLKDQLANSIVINWDDYGDEVDPDCDINDVKDYNEWNTEPVAADVKRLLNEPYDYILLDYPFGYLNDCVGKLIDLTVFIDTPLDVALARRIRRDYTNRSKESDFGLGYVGEVNLKTIDEELFLYLTSSRPTYMYFSESHMQASDLVVDGTKSLDEIVSEILSYIRIRKEAST